MSVPHIYGSGRTLTLSQVNNGVSLDHAVEQIDQVAGPKAGSQAELQVYSQNLEESLYQAVGWGLDPALFATSSR